jgi:hypothetical protein
MDISWSSGEADGWLVGGLEGAAMGVLCGVGVCGNGGGGGGGGSVIPPRGNANAGGGGGGGGGGGADVEDVPGLLAAGTVAGMDRGGGGTEEWFAALESRRLCLGDAVLDEVIAEAAAVACGSAVCFGLVSLAGFLPWTILSNVFLRLSTKSCVASKQASML